MNGGSTYAVGGKGRIAIYYFTSLTGYNCTSGNSCYAQNSSPTATPSPTSAGPTPTPSRTPTGIAPSLINYSYTDSSHVHAVTNLSNGNHYTYDLNGNMTQRTVNGVTWNIMYDAENHTQSLGNGSYSATYLYDGDGVRVGQTVNGVSTYYFAGGAYEVTVNGSNTSIRKYYSIAGQMVAMDDGSLHYLLTDHLGSVVAVASSSGVLESQQRYLPFGEPRNTPGITQTDFGFTGQKALLGTGLMDFRARIDDPYLNRFLQPDTIIPNLYNPQNLNRYSFVGNNPIRYNDPTGHNYDCGPLECPQDMQDSYSPPPSPKPGSRHHEHDGEDGVDGSTWYFRGYSASAIKAYFQSQGVDPSGCGPFSIAMAANIFNSNGKPTDYTGQEVELLFELFGSKIPTKGIPTWFDFQGSYGVFAHGWTGAEDHATIGDLKSALAHDKLPIVAVSWQTTSEILADPGHASVGHYMVAVGFTNNTITFLDPGKPSDDKNGGLNTYSNNDFNDIWNGKSNLFITAGSIFSVSSNP